MLMDRYELPLSTPSAAARDAYVRGLDLLLMTHPGVLAAFDDAVAADPGFALAHAGRAQILLMTGDAAGARAALDTAEALTGGITAREASQIAFLRTVMAGPIGAAVAALEAHLALYPRDALVLNTTANPNGLHGASGEVGQKARLVALMDRLAPHYGDDWWFAAGHAMALNEDGQRDAARALVERAYALQPASGWAAHTRAHLFYEDGQTGAAREFLSTWLPGYPRGGFLHGHLHWHAALGALEAGDLDEAERLHREAFSLDSHAGMPRHKLTDGASFLWRLELAGRPRDEAAWAAMHAFALKNFPRPGSAFADMHVALAQCVTGDMAGLAARAAEMAALAEAGRYSSGPVIPALARGFAAFARGDHGAVIEELEPLLALSERVGGSRAQTDLVEFTLLRACAEAGREADLRRVLAARRHGPAGVPVVGVLH